MQNSTDTQSIDSEYAIRRSEAVQKTIPEKDKFNWQDHHDYYVKKYRDAVSKNETLNEVEFAQYELALLREQQGFVNPLST